MHHIVEQPILGKAGTLGFIGMLATVPPLSTDLYISSLPTMAVDLHASSSAAGLTLSLFFIFMVVGMLPLGAVSDRVGRKPVLIVCSLASMAFCLASAFAGNIVVIIILRALQGIAGGALVAIGVALVKDCYVGQKLAKTLALTAAIALIAPLIAPVLGTAILEFTSWRGCFVALAILMFLLFLGSVALKEPFPPESRVSQGVVPAMLEVFVFFKNPRFMALAAITGMMGFGYMAYINSSSFVFIDVFGFSEVRFTVFFAVAAFIAMLGALLYMRMTSVNSNKALAVIFAVGVAAAIALAVFGRISGLAFLLCVLPWLFVNNFLRPMVTNLIIKDAEGNAGAASSFVNFALTLFTGTGMILASIGAGSPVFTTSLLIACAAAAMLVLCVAARKVVFIKE